MPQHQALFRSLRTLAKKRQSLEAMERRLEAEERKAMEAMSRILVGSGYRVVAADGIKVESGPRRRGRRLARQNLKCPKCGRRFAFAMHVARHVRAMHSAKQRVVRKRVARVANKRVAKKPAA